MIDHSGVHCVNPIIFLIKILFVRHLFSNCNVSPSSGLSLSQLALSFIGFLAQNTFIAFLFAKLIPKSGDFFIFLSYFDTVINIIARVTECYFLVIHSIYALSHEIIKLIRIIIFKIIINTVACQKSWESCNSNIMLRKAENVRGVLRNVAMPFRQQFTGS